MSTLPVFLLELILDSTKRFFLFSTEDNKIFMKGNLRLKKLPCSSHHKKYLIGQYKSVSISGAYDVRGWQISDKIYNLDPASLLNQTEGILSFIPGDALF